MYTLHNTFAENICAHDLFYIHLHVFTILNMHIQIKGYTHIYGAILGAIRETLLLVVSFTVV